MMPNPEIAPRVKGLLAKNRRYAKNPLIQPRRAGIVGLKAGLRRFTLT